MCEVIASLLWAYGIASLVACILVLCLGGARWRQRDAYLSMWEDRARTKVVRNAPHRCMHHDVCCIHATDRTTSVHPMGPSEGA